MMKFICLSIFVALLFSPVPVQSDGNALNMNMDWVGWKASFTESLYALSNVPRTIISEPVDINTPVLAEYLGWNYLNRFDWHTTSFIEIEGTFWLYVDDQLIQTQIYDLSFGSALTSIQYFDLGHSVAEWSYFKYDHGSVPIEKAVPMPATILLICLGLIGLVGFARKIKKG